MTNLLSQRIFLYTPLWYNHTLQIPIKREWLNKGVFTIWDVVNQMRFPLELKEFEALYEVKTIWGGGGEGGGRRG